MLRYVVWSYHIVLMPVEIYCTIILNSIGVYLTISHFVTLQYITLHYIALHDITIHYVTLHCITLPCITLHSTTIHIYIYGPSSALARIAAHTFLQVANRLCLIVQMKRWLHDAARHNVALQTYGLIKSPCRHQRMVEVGRRWLRLEIWCSGIHATDSPFTC